MPDIDGRLAPTPLWKGKKAKYFGTNLGMWGLAKYWPFLKETRVIYHDRDMEVRTQAVGMGLHARLGATSPIRALDGELFKMIMDIATPPIVFNG